MFASVTVGSLDSLIIAFGYISLIKATSDLVDNASVATTLPSTIMS